MGEKAGRLGSLSLASRLFFYLDRCSRARSFVGRSLSYGARITNECVFSR